MAGVLGETEKEKQREAFFSLMIVQRIYVGLALVTALLYLNLPFQTFNRVFHVQLLNEPNKLKPYFAPAPPPGPGAADASAAHAAAATAFPSTIRAPRKLLAS